MPQTNDLRPMLRPKARRFRMTKTETDLMHATLVLIRQRDGDDGTLWQGFVDATNRLWSVRGGGTAKGIDFMHTSPAVIPVRRRG